MSNLSGEDQNDGKGIVGINIHNLQCAKNGYNTQGPNPFKQFIISDGKVRKDLYDPTNPFKMFYTNSKNFAEVVKCYNPPINSFLQLMSPGITTGQLAYRSIKDNIIKWVEEAIEIRNNYKSDLYWPF